ncbi:MAG: hypothetical protein IKV41_06170 [Oscillospiraceae bacterium]|nr:hypothetical protein [Oscillospiraceae bacterium]
MRVTQNSLTRNYLRNMNTNLSRLSKTQERMLGAKYSKASENLADTSRAIRVRQNLHDNENYATTIRDAEARLSSAESNITSINDILVTAREQIMLSAANDTDATARDVYAQQIECLRDEILQFANAKYADTFMFGGSENGQAPFSYVQAGDQIQGTTSFLGERTEIEEFRLYIEIDGIPSYGVINFASDTPQEFVDYMNQTEFFVDNNLRLTVNADGGYDLENPTGLIVEDLEIIEPDTVLTPAEGNFKIIVDGETYTMEIPAKNNGRDYMQDDELIDAINTKLEEKFGLVDGVPAIQIEKSEKGYTTKVNGDMIVSYPDTSNLAASYRKMSADEKEDAVANNLQAFLGFGTEGAVNNLKTVASAENGMLAYNGIPVDYISYDTKIGSYVYGVDENSMQLVPENQAQYVDIGLGLVMTGNQVQSASAFKVTFSGLDLLSCGTNEKGEPNNVINILTEAAKLLREEPLDKEKFGSLTDLLKEKTEDLRLNLTDIGTKCTFLDQTATRIEDDIFNLKKLQEKLEVSDTAEESINWQMYTAVMNATYQFGSQVLPVSLMDFIK